MEMEVTMVGLQNAGKTSLLRVLAVGFPVFVA
jgi:GTPase SAR1 family protein